MFLKRKRMVELFLCLTVPPTLFVVANYIDNQLKQLELSFRDKSARYGKDLKPGDPPSW